MQANINFDFSELDSQFKKISDGSRRSLSEQNRLNSIMYLREMMYATRKRSQRSKSKKRSRSGN